jgi:hypothetical protein
MRLLLLPSLQVMDADGLVEGPDDCDSAHFLKKQCSKRPDSSTCIIV